MVTLSSGSRISTHVFIVMPISQSFLLFGEQGTIRGDRCGVLRHPRDRAGHSGDNRGTFRFFSRSFSLLFSIAREAPLEARRREDEASSDEIASDWGFVALAVARLIGRRKDVDPLVRLAMNVVLVPDRKEAASRKRRSLAELRPAHEAPHVRAATTLPFRIQFVGAARVARQLKVFFRHMLRGAAYSDV